MKPRKHIFVCINERPEGSPKGCCLARGGGDLFKLFKQAIKDRGLTDVKVTRARCLGPCEQGANVTVYPDAIWYCGVQLSDVPEIIESHIITGKPLERLMNPEMHTKNLDAVREPRPS